MCQAAPLPRCAPHAHADHTSTMRAYADTHPGGPEVDPLSNAEAAWRDEETSPATPSGVAAEERAGAAVTSHAGNRADELPAYTPARPTPPGYVDLYHRTTVESAAAVEAGSRMASAENTDESYFSTHLNGQAEAYGEAVVWVRVPEDAVELDDEFPDGEQHYRVPNRLVASTLMRRCQTCGRWDGRNHTCAER